jgi:bla regulator protein BlaR1
VTSSILIGFGNHLWQSTLFAALAGGLTLLLRSNSARVRWSLWLAASIKFLVPFALLTAVGSHIPWPSGSTPVTVPGLIAVAGHTVVEVTKIGGERVTKLVQASQAVNHGAVILMVLEVVWGIGISAVATRRFTQWLRVHRVLRESAASSLPFAVPVRLSGTQFEPAVVGILRPVLLLPEGMQQRLAPAEMDAVLAHERCHVACRDNLAASLHMLVEALFWFHPLVWWLGSRLVDERERACDERVLAHGHTSRSYAEGLLKVCEHYLQSPLASAAGVSGGQLSRRIEAIMHNRSVKGLGAGRKALLTVTAFAALATPLAIGSLTSPHGSAAAATADSAATALRNVTIRLAPPPVPDELPAAHFVAFWLVVDENGAKVPRIQVDYPSLRGLVAAAYDVDESQVVGKDLSMAPKYQIRADIPWPESPTDTGEERAARFRRANSELPALQRELLATHFGLVVKRERRQLNGYVLTVGSGGSKLQPDSNASFIEQGTGRSDREYIATMTPVGNIVHLLEAMFHAPVVDETGLKGTYDYKLTWPPTFPYTTPEPPTMAKALEEQLGLHLEGKPVTVDVIDVISLKSPDQVLTSR